MSRFSFIPPEKQSVLKALRPVTIKEDLGPPMGFQYSAYLHGKIVQVFSQPDSNGETYEEGDFVVPRVVSDEAQLFLPAPYILPGNVLVLFETDNDGDTQVCAKPGKRQPWQWQSEIAAEYRILYYLGTSHWALKGGTGNALRSDDDGLSFANKLTDCLDICRAANGWLWAIQFVDVPGPANVDYLIRKSPDNGENWVTSFTKSYTGGFNTGRMDTIAAHPTDPDIVAALGHRWVESRVWVTEDATAGAPAWATKEPNIGAVNVGWSDRDLAILATDRIVLVTYKAAPPVIRVAYADSPYNDWSIIDLTGAGPPNSLLRTSEGLFCSKANGELMISADAEMWENLVIPAGYEVAAMHYDEVSKYFWAGREAAHASYPIATQKYIGGQLYPWRNTASNLYMLLGSPGTIECKLRGISALS